MKLFFKVTISVAGAMLLAVGLWAAAKYHIAIPLLSASFLPHQYCYLQQPPLVWTNAVADGLIWLSYLAIAAGLLALLWKTRNLLPFSWVFVAFGTFIVACGFTHFFEVVTLWNPLYWLATSVKAVTAIASVATAIAFAPLVPRAAHAIRLYREKYSRSEEQRVRTLSRLLDAEEHMKLAMESAGFGTWDYDPATQELQCDDRCRAVFGVADHSPVTLDDLIARVHVEDRARVESLMADALAENREYTAGFRVATRDDEIRNVIAKGKRFMDGQGPGRFIGVVMDVTRARQAEDALVKAERLAVAGRMAASIAHEVNNPLSAALGNVYLARTAADVPDEVRERLEAVEQELNRAGQITQSTLTFYRESPHPLPTNLAEVVESVLTFQEATIRKAGVEVETRLRAARPLEAFPGELRQIIMNLVLNAVEALPPRGRLAVRVHPARDWRTGREGYRIVVADTGAGIPAETRAKLFTPFFTTKGERGTGLGLWITSQLVQKHGGLIRVRSRHAQASKNSGTAFLVWLPLAHDFTIPGRAALSMNGADTAEARASGM